MPITQAQIDQLTAQVAALSRSVGALVADPAPGPPVGLGLYSEHNAAYFGAHHYPLTSVDANGVPVSPPVSAGLYATLACPPGKGAAVWGSSTERHAIVNAPTGEQWGILEAYEQTATPAQHYPQETVKALWINRTTGVVRDISRITPVGPTGTPMAPQVLIVGSFGLCLWAYACNPDGTRAFPYYWQAEYENGAVLPNPAWTGDAQTTRQCFKLREAWWDNGQGWTDRGHGAIIPWASPTAITGNTPVDPGQITFTGWQAFARGVGAMWVYQYPNFRAAVTSVA